MSNELMVFNNDQINLIKSQIAVGATDDELSLFLYQATKIGLDPLAKQIYFQKYTNRNTGESKMTIICSIDGYRLIASRTGEHVGTDEAVFDDENKPSKATVTVFRLVKGIRCSFTASARWAEYYPGDSNKGHMWRKMPCTMLAKCAESQALRKAFPNELSNLYITEEMEQADNENSAYEISKEKHDPVRIASAINDGVITPKQETKPEPPKIPDENVIYHGTDEQVERLMSYLDKTTLSKGQYGDAFHAAMKGKPLSYRSKLLKLFLEQQDFDKKAAGEIVDGEVISE